MIINHNIPASNTYRQFGNANKAQANSMEKLSSGQRINKAGDDAAGLAISEKMRGQIKGLDMAGKNAQDGISLIQTAEGALNETHSILQRMRELAVQSANDTNTASDRSEIQKEVSQLTSEIDRISSTTEFNTKKLLNGEAGVKVTSSNGSVTNAIGDADTQAGPLAFTGFTLATAKTQTTDAALAATTTAIGAASTLTVNGTTFTFAATDTVQQVLDAVNAKTGTTGVSVGFTAGATFDFATTEVGSSAELTLAGTGLFAAGNINAAVNGTDAAAAGVAGTTVANGNHIEFISGAAKGLSFNVAGTAAATLTVDTNNALKMQIGANAGQNMSIAINDMSATALGVKGVDVTSQTTANTAITTVNNAIEQVSAERSKLGAYQNRLDHTINNLGTSSENLSSAESRIRDVDMAKEMMTNTKNSILSQAAQAMLAQANQSPKQVLQLLQ